MVPRAKFFSNLLVFLLSLVFWIGVTEVAMRFFFSKQLGLVEDEKNLTYRYDDQLGWFPVANSKNLYTGSRSIQVEHNSRGFRDAEHIVDDKPGIIFLGDSFVWGYDVEKQERFTEKLREKLTDWSVYNLGVSGYGTDQEYLLLQQQYDFYHPNIVFLVFCIQNDEKDNTSKSRYKCYYKPYFISDGDNLILQGVPVHKSVNYFFMQHPLLSESYWFRLLSKAYFKISAPWSSAELKNPTQAILINMNKFVKGKGAKFAVGLTERSSSLEKFLQKEGIPYVDLENTYRYPSHGGHWTPEGHTFVSDKIYDFLLKAGFLRGSAANNAP